MADSGLSEKLTVITTPHYGHLYLRRFLSYYQHNNWPVKILILDSSPKKYVGDLGTNEYIIFDHKIKFGEKLCYGLSRVRTPYAAICSEDDFLIPTGLVEAIDVLEQNINYSVAQGRTFSFNLLNDGIFSVYHSNAYQSIEDDSALVRALSHLKSYHVTYSAVHRTRVLKFIWQEALSHTDDYRLGEILPSLLSLICGKLKTFNRLYCARRYSPASTGQMMNQHEKGRIARDNYQRFKACLKQHLIEKCPECSGVIDKMIDSAMEQYLGQPLWRYFISKSPIFQALYRILKYRIARPQKAIMPDSSFKEAMLLEDEKQDYLLIKKMVEMIN